MSTLDIIIIAPILFGAYQGYKKGFVLEVIAILSFILAIIGGFKLMHWGMNIIDSYFEVSGDLLPFISFIVIFISIILLVNAIGKLFKRIIDLTLLGSIDNLAGALMSAVKWVFGISVLLWLTSSFGIEPGEDWTADSFLYEKVLAFAPNVVDHVSVIVPYAHDLFDQIKILLGSGDTAS